MAQFHTNHRQITSPSWKNSFTIFSLMPNGNWHLRPSERGGGGDLEEVYTASYPRAVESESEGILGGVDKNVPTPTPTSV
jgi:hypothetical protein